MNKRQKKKYIKNEYPIDPVFYCVNRKSCGDECDGCSRPAKIMFRRLLKREHISCSGWELSQVPLDGVYIFYNHKKHKEITLLYDRPTNSYEITVYDPIECEDTHMDSITQALHSCYQNAFHWYRYYVGTRDERRKRIKTKKTRKYKEKSKKGGSRW